MGASRPAPRSHGLGRRSLGKRQEEGQEDQGTLKQLGGPPLFYLSLVLLAFLLALPRPSYKALKRLAFALALPWTLWNSPR